MPHEMKGIQRHPPPIFYRPRSFPTELDFIVAKGFGRTLFYHILPDLCITAGETSSVSLVLKTS